MQTDPRWWRRADDDAWHDPTHPAHELAHLLDELHAAGITWAGFIFSEHPNVLWLAPDRNQVALGPSRAQARGIVLTPAQAHWLHEHWDRDAKRAGLLTDRRHQSASSALTLGVRRLRRRRDR